ncbi:hypothetical protein [Planktothrix sp. PCC 11201]|uniref:hypothetical protein n=1 Tax=Planktothrix sp. PCC 11201 TaxID=1729650 RepID=UPI00117FB042|nr:hypothetical protein [Planktothrix sp. PCC 11201]
MNTLNPFPLPEPENRSVSPLAVLSGEFIHIIHPNGKVEMTTTQNIEKNPTKYNLETCVVWGRFEEF